MFGLCVRIRDRGYVLLNGSANVDPRRYFVLQWVAVSYPAIIFFFLNQSLIMEARGSRPGSAFRISFQLRLLNLTRIRQDPEPQCLFQKTNVADP